MTVVQMLKSEICDYPVAVLARRTDSFGFATLDLAAPPSRLCHNSAIASIGPVASGIDAARVTSCLTPAQLLGDPALAGEKSAGRATDRARARLLANFLVAEDPQRRLDARAVETLAHQVSLVRHILDTPNLKRVLIADEVGLGKTVEVGLLLQELIRERPGIRILYLAPARLVSNVRREFDQLDLAFRQWTSSDSDARLADQLVIASLHKAIHGQNPNRILEAAPWDVLVVDECHHLSAWGSRGGDMTNAFKLVRDLVRKQPAGGRLVLMSGTPHQGSAVRFRNLLSLLRAEGEQDEAIRGRVIYRTKEDVRDWNGKPLFPPRIVNKPTIVDLGPECRRWMDNIYNYFQPKTNGGHSESVQRAAGWRCALALQWAASSPHAGLGYLIRHAIRSRVSAEDPSLQRALSAIRPYRHGTADEPITNLYARITSEIIRQSADHELDDIEDDAAESGEEFTSTPITSQQSRLGNLLNEGTELVSRVADAKWDAIWERIIRPAGSERVVLFAQPIETVCALARYIERKTGSKPCMIIGGQTDEQRQLEVRKFQATGGPQFLVSSRAGGEGLNLQVARRLVHVDVPWNPMELEQRVGRVHRFGSRLPIIVDTVVAKDSREADAYRVARRKLELIAGALTDPSRFEMIFSRVMALVPPEELQDVLIGAAATPWSADDEDRLSQLVQAGFEDWRTFHDRYGQEQSKIRSMAAGYATWSDLADFCVAHAGAERLPGLASDDFGRTGVDRIPVIGLRFKDSHDFVCGDHGGTPIAGPDGRPLRLLGLNNPIVSLALHSKSNDETVAGTAYLKGDSDSRRLLGEGLAGILVMRVQEYHQDPQRGWTERAVRLHGLVVQQEANAARLSPDDLADLIRWIQRAKARRQPGECDSMIVRMVDYEQRFGQELWIPTPEERATGIHKAVTPLFAGLVSP